MRNRTAHERARHGTRKSRPYIYVDLLATVDLPVKALSQSPDDDLHHHRSVRRTDAPSPPTSERQVAEITAPRFDLVELTAALAGVDQEPLRHERVGIAPRLWVPHDGVHVHQQPGPGFDVVAHHLAVAGAFPEDQRGRGVEPQGFLRYRMQVWEVLCVRLSDQLGRADGGLDLVSQLLEDRTVVDEVRHGPLQRRRHCVNARHQHFLSHEARKNTIRRET